MKWNVRTAPLHASDMDLAGALLRWSVGIGMVAYSIGCASLIIGWVLLPWKAELDLFGFASIPWRYLVGIVFGIAITIGEWATTKRAPTAHWFLVLVLDAPFGAYQTYDWLAQLVSGHGATHIGWYLGVGALSLVWGVVAAKFGEKLLITATEPASP